MKMCKTAKRSTSFRPLVEGLENRQFLSASPAAYLAPLAAKAPPPVVQLSGSPKKILAGSKPSTELVTIHNYGTVAETINITITLTPSVDGVTSAGSYTTPSVSETLTINKHGAAKVKVPFVVPITLAAGKYRTLGSVDFGSGNVITAVAPGSYTLTLPPLPTTTPTLVGDWVGLITATSSQSTGFFGTGTTTSIHQASFIWQATSQNLTSLTGLFAVGDQNAKINGVANGLSMQGYELNNGVIHYTLTSDDINYTIDGKLSKNNTVITGKFKGTLVNNIFKSLGGSFRLVQQTL